MESPENFPQRNSLHRVGIYLLLAVALGVGGGALIYTVLMKHMGWPLDLGSNSVLSSVQLSAARVLLYRSPTTERYYASVKANYDVLLNPWRNFSKNTNVDVEEIVSLDGLEPKTGQVLVLPSAVALDDAERAALVRFHQRGGNLLLTWAAGSRDGRGQWVGWDFMRAVSGMAPVAELPLDGSLGNLVTRGEGPLSHALDAGSRLPMGKPSERALVLSGGVVGAFATNWARQSSTPDLNNGVLAFSEISKPVSARTVVFGVPESSWEFAPTGVHNLVSGMLMWLIREPAVIKANWPEGLNAAYLVEMDTEDQFANALVLANQFRPVGYQGSFYVLVSEAERYPRVMAQLGAGFDLQYHGDTHNGFKGQTEVVQRQRIARMTSGLAPLLTSDSVLPGFRAPTESYDDTTEQVLYTAGIRHHLADPARSTHRLPFFAPIKGEKAGERFVVMPRTQRDDLNLMQDTGGDATLLKQALLDDFNTARAHGGLGVLSVHSQQYADQSPMAVAMPELLNHMKNHANTVWLASASQIAKWWSERERLRIRVRPLGARTEVDVSVVGDTPFAQGALIVMLPEKLRLPVVRGLKPGMPQPVVHRLDDFRAVIRFGVLPVGDYSYQLSF